MGLQIQFITMNQPKISLTMHKNMTESLYHQTVSKEIQVKSNQDLNVVNTMGETTTQVFRNKLPRTILQDLYSDLMQHKTHKYSDKQDSRGTSDTLCLGYYLESGGQGRTLSSKFHQLHGEYFSKKYSIL